MSDELKAAREAASAVMFRLAGHERHVEEVLDAFLSELSLTHVVVPRKPTEEMVKAGIAAWLGGEKFEDEQEYLFYETRAWLKAMPLFKAMIEAASRSEASGRE